MNQRLDKALVGLGLVSTRSQAESYIKLGKVTVNKKIVKKPGTAVSDEDKIRLIVTEQYVSRAGLKLASITQELKLDFKGKTVLDVGSSTGGFTEYALKHGAKKVIAVEVGSNQMDPRLRGLPEIELHEQTDIRNFKTDESIDTVVADVSFISLREILPSIKDLSNKSTEIVVMAKPQFETEALGLKHKGVIKNDKMRRDTLKGLEEWIKNLFVIVDKADSKVAGAKGNLERFYLLRIASPGPVQRQSR